MGKLITKQALDMFRAKGNYGEYLKRQFSGPFIIKDPKTFVTKYSRTNIDISFNDDNKWVIKVQVLTQLGHLLDVSVVRGFTVDQDRLEDYCIYQEVFYLSTKSVPDYISKSALEVSVQEWSAESLKWFKGFHIPSYYLAGLEDKLPDQLELITGGVQEMELEIKE